MLSHFFTVPIEPERFAYVFAQELGSDAGQIYIDKKREIFGQLQRYGGSVLDGGLVSGN